MARKFKKSKGRSGKRKWRQQKLAVGTVQKIAREIAQAEDQRMVKKYVHTTKLHRAGFTWDNHRSLPEFGDWQQISGNMQDTLLPYSIVSSLGGNVISSEMPLLNGTEEKQLELRIHGVETFGIVKNNSDVPIRVEARLLWIPNLNQFTQASIDYLVPRITMFYKSGRGVGNLLRQGYARRSLTTATATGVPVKFTTLDRVVLHLPATNYVGTVDGNQLSFIRPYQFKRFKLSKYFLKPRRGFVGSQSSPNDIMSNGNYVICYWSDQVGTATFSFLATTNLQYSIKQNMNTDTGA